jgi:superfamily II DNA or RNA helicase
MTTETTQPRRTAPAARGARRRRGLRPYQAKSVRAVTAALAEDGSGQVHMACGTGKTLVYLRTAERLVPGAGLVVVLVPTIALVAQSLADCRADADLPFAGLAVCSDDTVADAPVHLADLGLRATTDPDVVTEWLTTQLAGDQASRRYVFATYHSAGVVAEALHTLGLHADLLVCDEAHHLTGVVEAETRKVMEPGFLPARRRLFLTATPRDDLRSDAVLQMYGMDDEALFGPVLASFPFDQAIAGGWLKDYRIAVIGVTEDEARALLAEQDVDYVDTVDAVSLRTLATQLAVAQARRRFGVRRVISFHYRVADALEFSRTFPRTLDRLEPELRPAGRGQFAAVHSAHTTEQRESLLDHLRHPPEDGWSVVANARLLSEGVNIPAVDAVAFGHPKKSAVDIVQAVGRALRGRAGHEQDSDDGGGDMATLIVPIVVPAASDTEEITDLDPREYATLWEILRALRAHDERFGIELDHTRQETHTGQYELPERISVYLPPGTADHVLDQLTLLTVRQSTSPWMEGLGAAKRYHARHGDLLVGRHHVDEHGFRLGQWIGNQRAHAETLSPTRRAALDELGMVWNALEAQWDAMFTIAATYHRTHGHLRVKAPAVIDGENLGAWLSTQRHAHTHGRLSRERTARLDSLGMWWGAFAAGLEACDRYRARYGDLDAVTSYVDDQGYPLGAWLATQRVRNNGSRKPLPQQQCAELDARGMIWSKQQPGRALTEDEQATLIGVRAHGSSVELTDLIVRLVEDGVVQRQIAAALGVTPSTIRNRLRTRAEGHAHYRSQQAWYLATRRQSYAALAAAHPEQHRELYEAEPAGPSRGERASDALGTHHPAELARLLQQIRAANPFADQSAPDTRSG